MLNQPNQKKRSVKLLVENIYRRERKRKLVKKLRLFKLQKGCIGVCTISSQHIQCQTIVIERETQKSTTDNINFFLAYCFYSKMQFSGVILEIGGSIQQRYKRALKNGGKNHQGQHPKTGFPRIYPWLYNCMVYIQSDIEQLYIKLSHYHTSVQSLCNYFRIIVELEVMTNM